MCTRATIRALLLIVIMVQHTQIDVSKRDRINKQGLYDTQHDGDRSFTGSGGNLAQTRTYNRSYICKNVQSRV